MRGRVVRMAKGGPVSPPKYALEDDYIGPKVSKGWDKADRNKMQVYGDDLSEPGKTQIRGRVYNDPFALRRYAADKKIRGGKT